LKGNASSPQHKTNLLYKIDIIILKNMTDFKHSEMTVKVKQSHYRPGQALRIPAG
jgi:hypothetical protein